MFAQKFFRHTVIFCACLLIFGRGPGLAAAERISVPEISVDQVKQMIGMPDTAIIDVRRFRSWWRSSKKIVTAVREDPSKVDKWAQKYTKNMTLIFYCS